MPGAEQSHDGCGRNHLFELSLSLVRFGLSFYRSPDSWQTARYTSANVEDCLFPRAITDLLTQKSPAFIPAGELKAEISSVRSRIHRQVQV